jgi:hypothetical protein
VRGQEFEPRLAVSFLGPRVSNTKKLDPRTEDLRAFERSCACEHEKVNGRKEENEQKSEK